MADDRYTAREKAIVTILTANLASTYNISNKDSINLGAGEKIYNVLVHWEAFGNETDSGDTCYETDRERYRLILTPLSGVLDDTSSTQCNKMTADVTDILRNSSLVNATTIGTGGECLTQFRVDGADKGYYQKRQSVQLTFSFLADE